MNAWRRIPKKKYAIHTIRHTVLTLIYTRIQIHPMNNRANSDEDGTDDDGNQNTHGCKQRKTFARQTASSSSKRIVQEQTDEDTDSKGDSSSDVYSISDTTDNSEEDNSSDEDDDVRFQRFTGKKRGQYRVKSHLIAEIAEKESIKIDYAPSQQSPSLSRDQEFITELVVEKGENIFFTGPAGVGKSFTLNSIIDRYYHLM